MIVGVCFWILLFVGIFTQNANFFIASGVFAVALQIYLYRKLGVNNECEDSTNE